MMSNPVSDTLFIAARHARWVLVLGLLAGLLFEDLALAFKPYIAWFIVLLLFTACFRIGPKQALGALADLHKHLYITLILQILVPLSLLAIVVFAGWQGHYATAFLLVAAAAPVAGSPNLVMMLGHDPAPALRQLVVGTALLPLTVIPVFYWMPQFGDSAQVIHAVVRLLTVIVVAAICGFALRAWRFPDLSERATIHIDGVSAILMGLVVIGLMWALGDAVRNNPWLLLVMLLFAFSVNFGLQMTGYLFWNRTLGSPYAIPMGVISGNRNIALYLTALPASTLDDLYLFIGCYQFPMYLTPLLLQRIYR